MKTRLSLPVEPFALLIPLILAFGLLIPWLGFYWDDWPVLLTSQLQGAEGFLEFYQYDRPVSAWTYIVTMPLLGQHPVAWHIFTLLLRWLTTACLWWTLVGLWPQRRSLATWTAALFAVYPVFTQQSIAVAYSQHWICYLLYTFSMGAMVQAWRQPRRAGLLTALALLAALLHMFTMEYFVGLELLRPVAFWILVSERQEGLVLRLRKVLLRWAPYLAALLGFVIWRMFFVDLAGEDANPPLLLYEILNSPLQGLLLLAQQSLQDIFHLFFAAWADTLNPLRIELTDTVTLLSWGAGWVAAGLSAVFFLRLSRAASSPEAARAPLAASPRSWTIQALVMGMAGVVLGLLPIWLTDRQVIVGMYSDRFALPAMLGASLVIVALVDLLIAGRTKQVMIISLLIGLGVSFLLYGANEYRWARIHQNRLFWQLAWRAPDIQPQTAFLSNGEVLGRMGLYSHAAAINLIYAKDAPFDQLPYWYFSIGREYAHRMEQLRADAPMETTFRHYTFLGNSHDSLILYYEPTQADCMRLVTPQDADDPDLPALVVKALPAVDLTRIDPSPEAEHKLTLSVFGAEPEHGWCYFFQKADLARQTQDWERAVELGDQAQAAGYSLLNSQSNTPQEWIPFIEGYAHMDRWEDARAIAQAALEKDPRMAERLCEVWQDLRDQTGSSGAGAIQQALEETGCGP